MSPVVTSPVSGSNSSGSGSSGRRPFRPARFLVGLLLAVSGISVILIVAANTIRLHHLGREITLPIIAFSVITGIFLLGGGFGVMTTAAAGTDESEFERLLNAGETLASTDARNPAPGLPHPENPELNFLNRSSADDTAA